jgi:tetratricopeptide (TPR) repeat protein
MPLTTALLAVALAATARAAPAAPWEGPPFQADPSAIASAASALAPPRDDAMDVLLDETSFSFDREGRCTTTHRLVYRAPTRQAAEAWARVSGTWAPWSEERPEIRARVVTSAGVVRLLDPGTLTEAGVDEGDDGVYTDRRVLRAPLPAAEAGAVVEEVVTIRETAPALAAGMVRRWYVGVRNPTRRVRLRLEAPDALPLAWRARGGATAAPRERSEGGRRTVDWDWTDVAPSKQPEPYRPPDATLPQIMFTTAPTWRAVAAQYGELVERQLAGDDLADVARSVVAPGEPPDRAAQKLLDWISGRVRYTGLELGEAAIVPARARETLARQFGDCKDLSLLLAGLLRAAGHPATLALLRTRNDEVVPELPGFGLFDHAIVVIPGPRPLFVDPTSPETPVGELPPPDQGRLALVVSPRTSALVKIPEAGPAENRILTSREIVLPEQGWAHAVETRELSGAPAAGVRAWRRYAAADRVKAEERDAKAAKERLNAEVFVASSYEGIDDARARVRVRLEADRSHWGLTGDDDAEAVGSAKLLADRLPAPLRPAGGGDAKEPPAREEPLWISEPYASELRYRIVPPPGFRAVSLPEAVSRKVGPVRLESAFAEGEDGTVAVTHRLEVGARRIAPADVAAIRAALVDVLRPDDPKIRFRRTSAVLLQAGKGREALDEIRRLVALHPREARHHNHLAVALIGLGMGEAARREARRAIELEPKNAWSHRVLSLVLSHDEIGRHLSPRCDLAGAVAAQRRAAELDPRAGTRARLAFLLEHDARCERFGEGAKLDEAIAVFRSIHEELKSPDHDEDYLEALVAGGRFQEALSLARTMEGGARRDAALVAAAAALEGPAAAAREAERLSPEARTQALQGALRALVRARRYPAVAGLLRAASAGASASAQLQSQAASFERIRRHEEVPLDPKDPAAMPRRFFRAALGGDGERAVQELVARDVSPALADGGAALDTAIARTFRKLNLGGFGRAAVVDISDSLMDVRVDGDPAVALRLTAVMPNAPTTVLYAVRRGDTFKLVATSPEHAGLAALARSRAEAGDLVNARRLLGWARDEGPSARREDHPGAVLSALWTHGADAGADELCVAAAALEAPAFPDRAVPLLTERRRAGPTGPARRALSWGLATAYVGAKRWAEALELADELLAADPRSEAAFELKVRALRELGRAPALRSSLEARLRAEPDSAATLRFLAGVAMRAGDADEVERRLRRVIELGKAEPVDYNNLAWAGLLRPALPPDAIAQAQKAAQLTGEKHASALHTLATLHAVRGEPAEAMQVLLKAIDQNTGDPERHDWLVIGRIAEHYGLAEDAAAAYARAIDGVGPDADASSSSAIARRWAARLHRG